MQRDRQPQRPKINYLWCLCHLRIYGCPLWVLSLLMSHVQFPQRKTWRTWLGPGEPLKTTRNLPSDTKMSLRFVSAPAEVMEEAAEGLPLCPTKRQQSTTSQKLAGQVFFSFFFKRQTAAMPDKSTNEGQWNFVHRVRGFLWERLCGEKGERGLEGGRMGS